MIAYPSDIGGFVIGYSPIGGNSEGGFPPNSNTTLQNTIPSYLYVQYNDDADLQAFVASYNAYAQTYVDWFNAYSLSIYTEGNISGPLADWTITGLYGLARPSLPSLGSPALGSFNTVPYNYTIPYSGYIAAITQAFFATSDDVYKRVLTWQYYKGDGKQFNIPWLKRRIMRFLYGTNGTDYNIGETFPVSITFTGAYAATITLTTTAISTIFKTAVQAGVLELPFQISWTVDLT